jgi:hypothetical protein
MSKWFNDQVWIMRPTDVFPSVNGVEAWIEWKRDGFGLDGFSFA